jgi:hypothetical protein
MTKIIKSILVDTLRRKREEYSSMSKKMQEISALYKNALKCDEKDLRTIPKPTKIFTSIAHYRKIYNVILKWFEYRNYSFQEDNLLLSFLKNDRIYEYYVLLKLIDFFKENHYIYEESLPNYYTGVTNYKNTEHNNVFIFKKDDLTVNLYYQPVIYHSKDNTKNYDIGLFRNNDIPFDDLEKDRNPYYTPDYILKIEKNNDISYFILDAKYSTVNTIKKIYLSEIVYKYIFSISTVNSDDKIKGIYIINGKQFSSNNQVSMITDLYNSESINDRSKKIEPDCKILSLFPNLESDTDNFEHREAIAKLLQI